MDNTLEKIENYIVWIVVFLVPVVFLPIFPNYLVTAKLSVLALGVCLILLTKSARIILTQKLDLFSSPFDFPVFLFAIAYLASAILRTPNKMEAFFLPGTATIAILSALFYFLINQLKNDGKKAISTVLSLSGIVVSVFSLLTISGTFNKIPGAPDFLKITTFTSLGGNLPVVIFLIALVPSALSLIVEEEKLIKKIFFGITLSIITLGIAGNLYIILPGKPASPQLPPLAISWSVAVDSLKESPVFGIGPANFLTAFNLYRPISYNQTTLWQTRFTSANGFFLTTISEAGLLGLASLILLIIAIYRKVQKETVERNMVGWGFAADPYILSVIISFSILVFVGTEISIILLFFIFLALSSKVSKITLNFQVQSGNGPQKLASILPSSLVALPIIAAVLTFCFFATKAVRAEATYKKSLDAISRNDGTAAYNLLSSAILQNPKVDRYRATFSQINFALADTLARKPEGQQLTDEERNTVSQLIQQSISEAKATVALNPSRSGNWSLLASLYRSVMAFAQGADQYAIQSYSQAVALDPIDPDLRLSLGEVYYALGDYEGAIDAFKMAVLTKTDHANAHYNLAIAYREKGEFQKAISEMTTVLALLDPTTQDYQTAKSELEALEAKKPITEETTEATPESLTSPEPSSAPVVEPPIELPSDANPPVSPTPSPTAEEILVP